MLGSSSNSGKMTPEPVGFVLFDFSNVGFVLLHLYNIGFVFFNWSNVGFIYPKEIWNVIYLRNPARQFVNYSSASLSSDKLNFVG